MNKKLMTLMIAGLVGLPMAAAASELENVGVVTGHTVYANMGGFDEHVAVIAGLAESKVVWFNGQTIFSTLGEGFVYAVPSSAACSPLSGTNYTFKGYELSFRDPNDAGHLVAHYTYECSAIDELLAANPFGVLSSENHVWVTMTHDSVADAPLTTGDAGRIYNFAVAVDTELTGTDGELNHTGDGGRTTSEINNGQSYCAQEDDAVCNGGSMENEDGAGGSAHETTDFDLYFSKTDKGDGAYVNETATHPGTLDGCQADIFCAGIIAPGTYVDPTGAS